MPLNVYEISYSPPRVSLDIHTTAKYVSFMCGFYVLHITASIYGRCPHESVSGCALKLYTKMPIHIKHRKNLISFSVTLDSLTAMTMMINWYTTLTGRQHISLKRRYLSNRLHGVIPQNSGSRSFNILYTSKFLVSEVIIRTACCIIYTHREDLWLLVNVREDD
jgi:hypothetical protein